MKVAIALITKPSASMCMTRRPREAPSAERTVVSRTR